MINEINLLTSEQSQYLKDSVKQNILISEFENASDEQAKVHNKIHTES